MLPEKAKEMLWSKELFRRELKGELSQWLAKGLVTPEQAEALSNRYRLAEVQSQATGALLIAVYLIGATLIGGGVISFVAANWEYLPALAKVILVSTAMVACHWAGFHFWKVKGNRPFLGHGLIVLGTLIFGANIGLFAQIFHVHSHFSSGFGAWAWGALAMAYAVQSLPTAFFGLVASFVWFAGRIFSFEVLLGSPGSSEWDLALYPIALVGAVFPLVWMKKSGGLLGTLLAALGGAVAVCAWAATESSQTVLLSVLLVCLFSFAASEVTERYGGNSLGAFGSVLSVTGLMWFAYLLSFKEPAREMLRITHQEYHGGLWLAPVAGMVFGAVALWVELLRRMPPKNPYLPLSLAMLGGSTLLGTGILFRMPTLTIWAGNLTIVALAGVLVALSLIQSGRWGFWAGMISIAILIQSRFLEYETRLLLKSLVFILLGVGVIYGGLWFERRLKRRGEA